MKHSEDIMELLTALIEGTRHPENKAEKMFCSVFELSSEGLTLFEIYINMGGTHFTIEELQFMILGYALGQKAYVDLEELGIKNDNGGIVH